MSTISFLKEKLRDVSLAQLIRDETEQILLWLFKYAPGSLGFFLRYPVYKVLFNRLGGIPWIQANVTIWRTDRLQIGEHFGCNSGTYINAIGGIEIGNHVLIGSNVTISSGKHPIDGHFPPVFARPTIPGKIIIEDDVWIAANAVILPGVRLAKGTVVGANSVIVKDTEPYSVMAGVPAKLLRYRHEHAA
ncbi:acyltransferase [Tardiphaga sp. vice278]|uniref:acyltransferase n=1 Tax=Tardiphaga sp. vice278 TaxID=2592815 RepID=UPI00143CCEF6|nr:acyltransferase [Tardiphaga sp. vice278]